MSDTSRKRRSLDNHLTDNIKHIKVLQTAKENIPPEEHEIIIPDKNSTSSGGTEITTPKKGQQNLKEQPVTPSTNFKLLASLAADLDYAKCLTPKSIKEETSSQLLFESDLSDSAGKVNRKEKSLGIICTRFLAMLPQHPRPDEKVIVSLDEACVKLGVERRRLYDIVNVFESIDMLEKNAKNRYRWFGKNKLINCLVKLKEAAVKENVLEKLEYALKTDIKGCKQSCILNEIKNFMFDSQDSNLSCTQVTSPEIRKEKSLGLMSQRFLMLFLVSLDKVISLGVAAKVLHGFLHKNEKGAQIKTQVRRLYDIANVLSSIGLIQKESFSHYMRKPSFKYIGPDLKNYKGDSLVSQPTVKNYSKSRSLARHSSFQEICAVAEIEHMKLKESCNSAPPFHSALAKDKENVKTDFENLQLNNGINNESIETSNPMERSSGHNKKITQNASPVEVKPKPVPVLVKPNLKFILKNPTTNPAINYVFINSLPKEKSDIKYTNTTSYGNQTYLLINSLPTKEVKPEAVEPVNKVSSPQTIILSPEQRDAILQSLNISLSSEQTAAIHLDGASQSSGSNVPCNILKITNKNTSKPSENKSILKSALTKDTESNSNASISISNTRSNTPSSSQTLDSPLSIPSGYVTPIPNISSDISFMSNVEVNDVLRKLEGRTGNKNLSTYSQDDTSREVLANNAAHSMNQVNQLISNDSRSSDSINLELSNIFKDNCLGETSKPKPFLIDEKTLLSPIKTNVPVQISVPSALNTPPYIVPESVFLFNTPPSNYQTLMKVNHVSSPVTVVPMLHAKNKTV